MLAAVLVVELWLNRIFARLAHRDLELANAFRRLDVVALFSFELASVLGTSLLLLGLGRVVMDRNTRGPLRLTYALIGGVASATAFAGVWVRLPARLSAHLHTSALFLLAVMVIAALTTSSSRRLRAGIALLALPVALASLASLIQRFSSSNLVDPRASMLAELGSHAFVALGFLAPLLFVPAGPRGPLAPLFGGLVLSSGLLLGRIDWPLTARFLTMGIGVSVPVADWGLPVCVVAMAAYAYAIGGLLWWPGPDRLRGVGLALVCLVGLQLELPYQIASSLVGFLCLVESATRPGAGAITRAELDALLRTWAAALSARAVTIIGEDGREHARIDFELGGRVGRLRIERLASAIARLEMSVGEIPDRAASLSITSRTATRLAPSASGVTRVATDDPQFDRRYLVSASHGASARVDETIRVRIARFPECWIGVWPERGARFVSVQVPAGEDGLASLAQLLIDLSR